MAGRGDWPLLSAWYREGAVPWDRQAAADGPAELVWRDWFFEAASGAVVTGAVAFIGSGVLATTAVVEPAPVLGAAAFTASGSFAATGIVERNAAATLVGTMALGIATSVERRAAAVLAGSGVIGATAGITMHGAAALLAAATLAGDSSIERRGAVAIQGAVVLAVAAEEGSVVLGSAILAGQSVFAVLPTGERYGAAALVASSTMLGDPAVERIASLVASGSLLVLVMDAMVERRGEAALLASGTILAIPSLTIAGGALLTGSAAMAVAGESVPFERYTSAIPFLLELLLEPGGGALVYQAHSQPFTYRSNVLYVWESLDQRTTEAMVHAFEYTIAYGLADDGEEAAMRGGKRIVTTALDEKARSYIDALRANQRTAEWDMVIPTYLPDFLAAFGLRGFAIRINGYRLL